MRGAAGSPERRPAKLGRRMIARRRHVGVFVPDVPEYLVDNSSIGDERDDSHSAPAAGTQERLLLPDLPNELRPSYAPASPPFAFIAVGVIGRACRCLVSAVCHPALSDQREPSHRLEVYGAPPETSISNLAHISTEPRQAYCLRGFLHRPYSNTPSAVRFPRSVERAATDRSFQCD